METVFSSTFSPPLPLVGWILKCYQIESSPYNDIDPLNEKTGNIHVAIRTKELAVFQSSSSILQQESPRSRSHYLLASETIYGKELRILVDVRQTR